MCFTEIAQNEQQIDWSSGARLLIGFIFDIQSNVKFCFQCNVLIKAICGVFVRSFNLDLLFLNYKLVSGKH